MKKRFGELKAYRKLDNLGERNNEEAAIDGWQHLSRGVIKINSDVVVRGNNGVLGIVARNEEGNVIEVHSFKVCISDPMIAKLMVVKKAILVSLKNGWRNIMCESDGKTIVFCLNGGSTKELH